VQPGRTLPERPALRGGTRKVELLHCGAAHSELKGTRT
jgi:hypothetical protein